MSCKHSHLSAGCRIPYPRGAVGTSSDDPPSIGREDGGVDGVAEPAFRRLAKDDLFQVTPGPHLRTFIYAAGDNRATVRGEGSGHNLISMTPQHGQFLAAGRVPDLN